MSDNLNPKIRNANDKNTFLVSRSEMLMQILESFSSYLPDKIPSMIMKYRKQNSKNTENF